MSLLKAIKAQLGLSNTPANNFTITAEADNGTLKLARGNSGATTQDILTVDASGLVTAPQGLVTGRMVLATAQATTAGTSIDFTGIPSWVKRITVMFNGVSTNGSSNLQVQVGSGSFGTSGYYGYAAACETTSTGTSAVSSGCLLDASASATFSRFGLLVLTSLGGNVWTYSSSLGIFGSTNARQHFGSGSTGSALTGVLDRLRITTVNGTDTFDAGSVNILYEG